MIVIQFIKRFKGGAVLIASAFAVSFAQAQGVPFQLLSGESLQTSLAIEHFGGGLWSNPGEAPETTVQQERLELVAPFSNSKSVETALLLRGHRLSLSKELRTQMSADSEFPQDVGQLNFGFLVRTQTSNSGSWIVESLFGKSGTSIINDGRWSYQLNGFWRPIGDMEQGQWIYLLNLSNTRSFLNGIPIPGAAYLKKVKLGELAGVVVVGAPVMLTYLRSATWSFNAILSPFAAAVEQGYFIVGPFSLFLRSSWSTQSFQVTQRIEDRMTYEEFRTTVGVKGPVSKSALLTLSLSYCDGRRLIWGNSVFNPTSSPQLLADEVVAGAQIAARF